jgi:hypothetical protein
LRESQIPGFIVEIIILNKKLMNPYETGRLSELAVDCFVSMVAEFVDDLGLMHNVTGEIQEPSYEE